MCADEPAEVTVPQLWAGVDIGKKEPVMLLTGYQTPSAIRSSGARRIGTWLRHGCGPARPLYRSSAQ